MEDDADIGVAPGNRLKQVAVLDAEPARKCHPLVGENRLSGLLANQGLQCGDVLVPGTRLAFTGDNNAGGAARQIVEALNAERVVGCDQQRKPLVFGKTVALASTGEALRSCVSGAAPPMTMSG